MNTIENSLNKIFRDAIQKAFPDLPQVPKVILSTGKNTDYQCNNAMGLFAQLKQVGNAPKAPNDVAEAIVKNLGEANNMVEGTLCNNGFINFNLSKTYVADCVTSYVKDGPKPPLQQKQRVLIDFSSPNIAKDMHVGHLRSTIMGEMLAKVMDYCGHEVLRINHVGDWGTQFGMLITHLRDQYPDFQSNTPDIKELVKFYKASKARFDAEPEFKDRAYQAVVKLQGGDEDARKAWQVLCECSRNAFNEVYKRLECTQLEERGESFYNPYLESTVKDVMDRGIAHVDNGAKMVISCQRKSLTELTIRDIERIITLHCCNKLLSEMPAFTAVLENVNMVVAGEGENAEKVVKIDAKSKPIPISQYSSTSQKVEIVGKTVAAFAKALCEPAKQEKGKGKGKGGGGGTGFVTVLPAFFDFMKTLPNVVDGEVVRVPYFNTPFIIQKSDGGYLYGTTDLACIKYRCQQDKANRIIYVTDLGQETHFQMLFQAGKDAGYVPEDVQLDHVGFGLVLGPDGKKYKTRSGETERLEDLLDQACERLYNVMTEHQEKRKADNPDFEVFPEEELRTSSKLIGYGAIKYFDLKGHRVANYEFSYDKMLSVSGNTAVYLEYAYARYRSIARKAGVSESEDIFATLTAKAPIDMLTLVSRLPAAWALALHLARYASCIQDVTETLLPHKLCEYLYHLTEKCNSFYDSERVLGSDDLSSKLALVEAATRILKHGLNLMGVHTVERM